VTVAKKRKKKREPAVWIHITGAQKECKWHPGKAGSLAITSTTRETFGYRKNWTWKTSYEEVRATVMTHMFSQQQ
jgi:hypothetical protein